MAKEWDIKFRPLQIVSLTKASGETVHVRIESLGVCKPGKPMYQVREVVSGIGYPAMQSDLKAIRN